MRRSVKVAVGSTAIFVVLLLFAGCVRGSSGKPVSSDDYIQDGDGKRQLNQAEYDALIRFLATAKKRDGSGMSDLSRSEVVIDGVRYLVYWDNLCPNRDRTQALHIDGIEFSRNKNTTVDLTDVLEWAQR